LELLANLWADILIAGVKIAEKPLEPVYLFECKFSFAQRLHAFHDIEKPAASL